ncbi:MAG: hypothetical protein U1F61_03430 [Opitutaceae bacterium]
MILSMVSIASTESVPMLEAPSCLTVWKNALRFIDRDGTHAAHDPDAVAGQVHPEALTLGVGQGVNPGRIVGTQW